MLLRSSSTPVLGSLISSFTDNTPTHIQSLHLETCHALKHLPPPTTSIQHHHHNNHRLSCSSSPISPSISDLERQNKGFRRVQSEGNLEDLAYATTFNNNEERFSYMDSSSKRYSARQQRGLALETIPSFSLSKRTGLREEEEDLEESDIEDEEGYDEFSVMNRMMMLSEEVDRVCRVSFDEEGEFGDNEMYLAKGLGVDFCGGDGISGGCRGGGNGGGDYNSMDSERNDGENNNHGVEQYYKKMVQQNPGNPLFLRNYAQFLYQVTSISFCLNKQLN